MPRWGIADQKRLLMRVRGSAGARSLPQSNAPPMKPLPAGPSKRELREQAAAALAQWQQKQKGA
jgi:hypothetical protein